MGFRSPRRVITLVLGIAALLAAASAPAELLTGQAQALPGTTPSQSLAGAAIALSGDGSVTLVGVPTANGSAGAAYVYTKTGKVWSAPVALTLPTFVSSTPGFGHSVALSADGTIALVGAPFENSSAGAVYAYSLSGGNWSGPTALSVSGLSGLGEFGYALALSSIPGGDPEALVGAPTSNGSIGAAYIYTFTSGSWGNPTALSVSGVPSDALFGYSVALLSQAALVGAPSSDPTSTGYAYGYTESIATWRAPTALPTTGLSAGDGFGSAVALDLEGGLVGAPGTAGGTGAVYGYSYDTFTGGWYGGSTTENMNGVPSGGHFGASLAIGSDATIVGAPTANGSTGAVYFYAQQSIYPSALDSTGVESGAGMGSAIAVSTDGQTVAVTATGAAPGYVFGSPVDMAVAVTASATSVAAGHDATFTIDVGNPDQSETASDVTLTDVLPAGTTYVSASSQQGTCSYSQSTSTVTCSFGTVVPNVMAATTFTTAPSISTAAGSGVTISVGTIPVVPTWQEEVTLVVKTPAAGGMVQDTATLSADQELTGAISADASVTAQASGSGSNPSQGSGGSGSGGGSSQSSTGSGGGAFGLLSLLMLLGVGVVKRSSRRP